MNCCREIAQMGVPARHRESARSGEAGGPPGNRRVLVPRRTWTVRRRVSLSSFAKLRTSSLVEGTPEDARKDDHIRGRSK